MISSFFTTTSQYQCSESSHDWLNRNCDFNYVELRLGHYAFIHETVKYYKNEHLRNFEQKFAQKCAVF